MMALSKVDTLDLARQWTVETLTFFARPLEIIWNYRREDLRPDTEYA